MVHVGVAADPPQLAGDCRGRQDEVGDCVRALGHASVLRGLLVLDGTSDNWLSCLGSRCWMSTNAMPVSVRSSLRSWVKASSPPAEAPMPTTGNVVLSGRSEGSSVVGDFGVAVSGKRLDGSLGADL